MFVEVKQMAQAYVDLIKKSPFQDYTVRELREFARAANIEQKCKRKRDLVIALEKKNVKKIKLEKVRENNIQDAGSGNTEVREKFTIHILSFFFLET